jgi:hypothetical protein
MNSVDESTDVSKTVLISQDRRQFDRLPPQFEFVAVRTKSGESIAAKVENVSLGGIGLQLESEVGISASDEVDIVYLYAAMPAVVRYVEAYPDGITIAGLEWTKRPAP